MNPEQLQQKIAEYYAKLPNEMQVMFASMEWMKTIENLSGKYSLTPNQIQNLGTETTLLLLGIVHPDEYNNFLRTELALSTDIQNKLIADINLGILNKWKEKLAEVYTANTMEVAEKEYGGATKLDERFAKLPKEVQDAIANSNYQKELYAIGSAQKLSIDQMGELEKATNKILLGIEHPDTYTKSLENNLHLEIGKANELSTLVNDKILKNIRELLKNHIDGKSAVPPPPYKTPASTPVPKTISPDAVPIPPYKKPEINIPTNPLPTTPTTLSQAFEKSGIEMVKEIPVPNNLPTMTIEQKQDDLVMKHDGINIVPTPTEVQPKIQANKKTEENILDGIEHPQAMPSSILGDRLSKPQISVQTTHDQSTPSLNKNDPYREAI